MRARIAVALSSRVGRTTAWSIVAVALSMLIGMMTARLLMPEGRGFLALLVSLTGISALVSALGSNVALRRLLPAGVGVSVRGYWRLTHGLLGVLIPVQLVLYWCLTAFAGLPSHPSSLVAFLAYGVALFYGNQSVELLHAHGLPAVATRTNALGTLACLIAVAGCVAFGAGLVAAVGAYVLRALTCVVVSALVIRRRGLQDERPPRGERELLRTGPLLLGMTLGQVLTTQVDTLMLGVLSDPAQVGIYAVGVTTAGLLRLPATALGQVVMHDAASGRTGGRGVLGRLGVIVMLSLPLAVVGALAADWVLPQLFGAAFADAVAPFRVLLLAELALIPFLVLSRYVAARGSSHGASVSGMVGVFLLVAGSVLLIPSLGAVGAAWASVVASTGMSATAAGFARHVMRRERPVG